MAKTLKLKDLIGHPRNPRRITDAKLEMLKKSLKEFGDLSGILYNRKTKRLFGGHMRLRVLPPDAEIQIDGAGDTGFVLIDGDRFHCRFVNWDETKEQAAMIAANNHGGVWDFPVLTDLVNELDAANIDMALLGFDDEDLKKLMAPVFSDEPAQGSKELKEIEFSKFSHKCPRCQFEFNDDKKKS